MPSGAYHVTLRSAGPIPMFVDDVDNTHFCNLLARIAKKLLWAVRAFCLMPTHYHLVVETPENTLQLGMQSLNGNFANGYNRRRGRKGHLKGRRYGATPVMTDEHMMEVIRYIARNPVRAGLCERPRDWYWGSYRGLAGYDAGFSFVDDAPVLAYFGGVHEDAQAELRRFVGDD